MPRITPKIVLVGLAAHMALRLAALLAMRLGGGAAFEAALDATRIAGGLCAYALALLVCRGVAEEYRGAKWMRLAWLALTANAALSLLRPLVRSALPLVGEHADPYYSPPLFGLLLHLVIVPANLLLLTGLLAMWWAYREAGVGFTLERRDGAALAGLFALMLAFFAFHDILTEAQALYRATRVLQLVGQAQMFLIAAVALLLHRVAAQMEGGKLAVVLRWLTIYALLRLGMVLAVSLARASFPDHGRLTTELADFGWQAAPWLFALAVAYRAEVTALAAARLARVKEERLAQPT
jgi:hypothetical protein